MTTSQGSNKGRIFCSECSDDSEVIIHSDTEACPQLLEDVFGSMIKSEAGNLEQTNGNTLNINVNVRYPTCPNCGKEIN